MREYTPLKNRKKKNMKMYGWKMKFPFKMVPFEEICQFLPGNHQHSKYRSGTG